MLPQKERFIVLHRLGYEVIAPDIYWTIVRPRNSIRFVTKILFNDRPSRYYRFLKTTTNHIEALLDP